MSKKGEEKESETKKKILICYRYKLIKGCFHRFDGQRINKIIIQRNLNHEVKKILSGSPFVSHNLPLYLVGYDLYIVVGRLSQESRESKKGCFGVLIMPLQYSGSSKNGCFLQTCSPFSSHTMEETLIDGYICQFCTTQSIANSVTLRVC